MIHPMTELRYISSKMGFGVFATADIPKGTITYVVDDLDIVIPLDDAKLQDPVYGPLIERYGYTDRNGNWIISWDIGRYVNHCCHPNTITTGYDMEVAIRDIKEGEEITSDYGVYAFEETIKLSCDMADCRKELTPFDFDQCVHDWDEVVKATLPFVGQVEQPLMPYWNDPFEATSLQNYLNTGEGYRSVVLCKPNQANIGTLDYR